MLSNIKTTIVLLSFSVILFSCGGGDDVKQNETQSKTENLVQVSVPDFNEDSAYYYVKEQVQFGPRVPNTEANKKCAEYFSDKLKLYTSNIIVQKGKVRAYDGTILYIQNIIASFKPEVSNRILLCAHWDSRPFADQDPDIENHDKPIDGANDGASGAGVLMEIARQLSIKQPNVGVDIILFDAEDYGEPQGSQRSVKEDTWALGSQYWAEHPHKQGYFAKYGILLDMVGAKDAKFTMEGTSLYYAPDVMKKVWNTAARIGYAGYFLSDQTNPITDDHLYINEIIKIPTIDIIHHEENSSTGFAEHWHTTKDNIDIIDKKTLDVVGQTLLTVIFEEK